MTLVEKLEKVIAGHNAEFNKIIRDATDHQKIAHTAVLAGLLSAIKVVKQHSEWIPVSELPKEEKDWLVRFRKEDGFGLTMAVSKFYLEAQRFDCFHSKVTHYMELPKPPSEVQNV